MKEGGVEAFEEGGLGDLMDQAKELRARLK
jgi:hypothetical protein